MRRIARIQRPSAALTQCLQAPASAPQHTAACRAAATASTCLQRPRDFSTTPQRSFHGSSRRGDKLSTDRKKASTAEEPQAATATSTTDAQQQQEAAEQLLEAYDPDAAADIDAFEVDTDLVLPPEEISVAQRADELEAGGARYEPADTAHGLEVVGGLGGWFERDDHWGPSKRYTGFAPTHRVADPALLELNVRRAVAEALAVAAGGDAALLTGLWERGGKDEAARALGLRLEVREDGAVGLVAADVEGVVRGLRWDPDAPGSSVAAPGEEVGRQQFSPEEAKEIVQTWDQRWKSISLHDAQLKFAVTKRILQLTGYPIPDAKLPSIHTAGHLVALLVKPPPPTKVAEALEQQGELANLPNVRVHATRRTPVHEHQEVGRWKVIVQELEKRKIPTTGDGGIGKLVEDKWLRGPRLPKSERKKRR
ncbi:hypothetical protein N8I77_011486 [Diaporthe amygdali]|uniref:Large ribosomal subunit protein mL50 n=1 Tax=Phomopsis amygdali TaxID=1214568 RepID=A0AAD9S5P8_PHOAM|nr:hypothetical protein N8I77_011486 [Diaporthe amygdali]